MASKTKKTFLSRYEHVNLNVLSSEDLLKKDLYGVLSAVIIKGETLQTANFKEAAEGKSIIEVGERKWIPIKVNKQFGIRVTKNKETGEYRILCSMTKERLQNMTLRDVGELEAEFGLMIEKIRL